MKVARAVRDALFKLAAIVITTTPIDLYLSAADWKTALRASVYVPLKSTTMKNAAKAATRAERNTDINRRKTNMKTEFAIAKGAY